MKKRHRVQSGAVSLALGLSILAGCRQGDLRQPPLTSSASVGEPRPRLTAEQVADVQIALGRSQEEGGVVEQAKAVYQQAVKQDPNRADAWSRLAVLDDKQGKFDESLEAYQKALAAKPGCAGIYCNMGYSLYLQHRWAEAEMNLRQAIALQPDNDKAHNNLGLVLGHLGRDADALAEFRKGGCNEAEAHNNLAFVLTLEDRLPEAKEHYERTLALNPSCASARKALREIDPLLARDLQGSLPTFNLPVSRRVADGSGGKRQPDEAQGQD
jgi:Tfp pilus assembly protein PilF